MVHKFQTHNETGEFNLSTEKLILKSSTENEDLSVTNHYELDIEQDRIENWRFSQATLEILGNLLKNILTASGDDDIFDNLPALHSEFQDLANQIAQVTEFKPHIKKILSTTWDFAKEILIMHGAESNCFDNGPLFSNDGNSE